MEDVEKQAKEVFFPNTIVFESSINKVQTLADRGLSINLHTQELPSDVMAQLFNLRDQHCAVCIAPHGEELLPFDPVTVDAPKGKSPSERLRGVLYVLWSKDKKGYKTFEEYYLIKMAELTDMIKDKISKYE